MCQSQIQHQYKHDSNATGTRISTLDSSILMHRADAADGTMYRAEGTQCAGADEEVELSG